jgi:hypothetical protein
MREALYLFELAGTDQVKGFESQKDNNALLLKCAIYT